MIRKIFTFLKIISVISVIILNFIITGIIAVVHATVSYTLSTLPAFSSYAYVYMNENKPLFTQAEYTYTAFENYSDLDSLGRCGTAYALVCTSTMPTDERRAIGSVTPTGWVQAKYDTSLVSGGYLYNRCHLIGWQLTGENANKRNLITGTRYLNIEGMLGFEDSVAGYVKSCNGHVLYRVTPVFEGGNLLATGVEMEGYSVDDNGKSISFNVFCYNAQPGITIDYSTGASKLTVIIEVDVDDKKYVYILNTSTKKYHRPDCSSVKSMSAENKSVSVGTLNCPQDEDYAPCSICKADSKGALLGDVDSVNSVTVADARLVLRYAIRLEDYTYAQFVCGDADKSGGLTVADARIVLRISIGLE